MLELPLIIQLLILAILLWWIQKEVKEGKKHRDGTLKLGKEGHFSPRQVIENYKMNLDSAWAVWLFYGILLGISLTSISVTIFYDLS